MIKLACTFLEHALFVIYKLKGDFRRSKIISMLPVHAKPDQAIIKETAILKMPLQIDVYFIYLFFVNTDLIIIIHAYLKGACSI